MDKYPDAIKKDVLSITVLQSFDVGISQGWVSNRFKYAPQEWEKMIAGLNSGQQ